MSFFFGKSDSSDNLQYDDTASLHFAISVCIITTITFAALIYRDVKGQKKQNLAAIKNMSGFKQKIANTEKTKKNYFKTVQFLYKLGVIVACIIFGIYCYSNIRQDSKMIGFDPYEILGVSMDAEINTIKKAYRKLALQFHPDRNVNNPEAAAKFIQISKAYQCLTDEQAKQKCKKYGNPDGETSFKVGIGLPRFMVDMQNQYFILIPIFIIILVVIPRAFIKWSNRIKPMDDNGNLLVNYGMFTSYITPAMNPITFSVILGSMKQLDAVFPESTSKLDPQLQAGMKALLVNCRAVTPQQLQAIPQHVIFRICTVYSYMANRQRSQKLVQLIPDLCRKIIMFSLNFAQKSKDQQLLYNNPNWALTYYGFYPVELAIFFSKQMFNPSIRLGDTRSIEFLDLTPEQQLMAKNIPIGNLQYNLLWDDEKINNLSMNFSQERQAYIKKQIDNLPALKVQSKVLLGDEQVSQMTVDDFAILQVKVIRKKPTPGFVQSKDYPMLAKEQFYIAICYNQNVILFRTVNFKKGSNEAVFKCQHRQSFIREMKFDIFVLSNCYPNMDLREELVLNVTGRVQNRKIQIHKDDLNIQKFPKSFIQSLASMQAYNQSDKQLSEGSDNQEQENSGQKTKQQKGGFQEEQQEQEQGQEQAQSNQGHGHSHSHQQSGGCCDHEHGQKVQTGFKQETN